MARRGESRVMKSYNGHVELLNTVHIMKCLPLRLTKFCTARAGRLNLLQVKRERLGDALKEGCIYMHGVVIIEFTNL